MKDCILVVRALAHLQQTGGAGGRFEAEVPVEGYPREGFSEAGVCGL